MHRRRRHRLVCQPGARYTVLLHCCDGLSRLCRCQLRQHPRVALTGDQRVEHRPIRLGGHVDELGVGAAPGVVDQVGPRAAGLPRDRAAPGVDADQQLRIRRTDGYHERHHPPHRSGAR